MDGHSRITESNQHRAALAALLANPGLALIVALPLFLLDQFLCRGLLAPVIVIAGLVFMCWVWRRKRSASHD